MPGTPFGRYIRRERAKLGRSLREVADYMGVTHVYLGEVERGTRPALKEERWPELMAAIPTLTEAKLKETAKATAELPSEYRDLPPRYQNLVLTLSRRIRQADLSEDDASKLEELLGVDENE